MRAMVENILVFGDSLSDRGTMANSALAAFSGLWGNSPHGRFTNGYVWLDYFIRQLNTSDEVQLIQPQFKKKYTLFSINNDEYVGIETAPVFARTYCIGGMTAHDYSTKLSPGTCLRTATAKFLENLDGLREEMLEDDKRMKLSREEKQKTLVIEWSGANDLVTINDNPTLEAADLAVKARIEHLEKLIEQGYMHFVLFNLADLSLTPRYQRESVELRQQAYEVTKHLNQELQSQFDRLKNKHAECRFDIFDADGLFRNAYDNPDVYALDENKLTQPFLESSAFKDNDSNTTANGYMFWDDVHPTEAVHVTLSRAFYKQVFEPNYVFTFTEQPSLRQFQKMYGMRLDQDMERRCMPRSSSFDYLADNIHLNTIVHHGKSDQGKRTKRVMQALGWMNKQGDCTSEDIMVQAAFTRENTEESSLSRK